jgi:hypothetical protein
VIYFVESFYDVGSLRIEMRASSKLSNAREIKVGGSDNEKIEGGWNLVFGVNVHFVGLGESMEMSGMLWFVVYRRVLLPWEFAL